MQRVNFAPAQTLTHYLTCHLMELMARLKQYIVPKVFVFLTNRQCRWMNQDCWSRVKKKKIGKLLVLNQ